MSKIKLPPHVYRELIDRLRDTIVMFHNDEGLLHFIAIEFANTPSMIDNNPSFIAPCLSKLLILSHRYHHTQQLRELISRTVGNYIEPDHESKRSKGC